MKTVGSPFVSNVLGTFKTLLFLITRRWVLTIRVGFFNYILKRRQKLYARTFVCVCVYKRANICVRFVFAIINFEYSLNERSLMCKRRQLQHFFKFWREPSKEPNYVRCLFLIFGLFWSNKQVLPALVGVCFMRACVCFQKKYFSTLFVRKFNPCFTSTSG